MGTLSYPYIGFLKTQSPSWRTNLYKYLKWFRMFAFLLVLIALARPQTMKGIETLFSEGIDIVLILDASESMKAEDFTPNNRFYVAKENIKKFINDRTGDRIGLVVFGEEAFTQCPVTLDLTLLQKRLDQTHIGIVSAKRTAIGTAIATGLNRLRKVEGKSKVMILLTDGYNNSGKIDPLTAAGFAKQLGVKIYTIGVGKDGLVPMTVDDPVFGPRQVMVQTQIDETLLQNIAEKTQGIFFRATTPKALESIYSKIDELEKTRKEMNRIVNYRELYMWFLLPALLLILFDFISRTTYLRLYVEKL